MSTGLTYGWLADYNNSEAPFSASPSWIFPTYSDAYEFGEWQVSGMTSNVVVFWIWNSGSNQNGYWEKSGGEAYFIPVD